MDFAKVTVHIGQSETAEAKVWVDGKPLPLRSFSLEENTAKGSTDLVLRIPHQAYEIVGVTDNRGEHTVERVQDK